jgi:hypothetical protein
MSKFRFKDLGYAAFGATLSLVFPKATKKLKHEALLKRIAAYNSRRDRVEAINRLEGEALDHLAAITTKARTRCNHKKGGSLGRLTAKAWHYNGFTPTERLHPDGRVSLDFSDQNGLTRWEGEWSGENSYISGQGDAEQYAVSKHVFANGDMHIRCLRCGKNWKPGDEGYEEAYKFPTLNCISTSIQWGVGEQGSMIGKPHDERPDSEDEQKFQARYKAALGNRS